MSEWISADRTVVVCASLAGSFHPSPPSCVTDEGEWLERGHVLGLIRTADKTEPVQAPCDGMVVTMVATPGSEVDTGEPLFILYSDDRHWGAE